MKKLFSSHNKLLIGIFVLFIFLAGVTFVKADTASCNAASGSCVSGSCPTGQLLNGDTCDGGETCCVPDPGAGAITPVDFTNPLEFSTVEGVLASLLNALQGIIVVVSIIFIIIGAVFYITSAGNDKRMVMAKKAITASVIGLAIGIAAPSFLHEVSDIIGWDDKSKMEACNSITNLTARQQCIDALTTSPTLAAIAFNTLEFLLSIAGILAVIMLVVGGIMYLTGAGSLIGKEGSEKKVSAGKNIVKYSIIGIIIVMASLVIVSQIAKFFVTS